MHWKRNTARKPTTTIEALEASWLSRHLLPFTSYMFEHFADKTFVQGRHHRIVCHALDDVLDGRCTRLIINIAPRYSKTELAVRQFIALGLARDPSARFLHLSYSSDLAVDSSMAIKDEVMSDAYQRLFPDVQIRRGADTQAQWDTTAGGSVYATSTLGQITGFGAGHIDGEGDGFGGAIIIDDPIKPEDALSDLVRERVNRRFETTIRTRVNSRSTPIIIIMQRLHEHDLCGYLQEREPDVWRVVSLPCIYHDEDGNERALWKFKHTLGELHELERIDPYTFQTQYMQNPRPIEGLMYREFKTYAVLPKGGTRKCYTDTADTGSDYHCAIFYVERPEGNYITDVLYTKRAQEYTEPVQTRMLMAEQTAECYIESNNGGRAFARNVERMSREAGNGRTRFVPFTQRENKQTRIFTRANEVNNLTLMPEDWERRWYDFARDIKAFRREGHNAHDDAEDAITGTIEKRRRTGQYSDREIEDMFS